MEGARVMICARDAGTLEPAAGHRARDRRGDLLRGPGDFLATPDEGWLEGWSLELLGSIRMAREVLPHMQRQSGGYIVNAGHRRLTGPREDGALGQLDGAAGEGGVAGCGELRKRT